MLTQFVLLAKLGLLLFVDLSGKFIIPIVRFVELKNEKLISIRSVPDKLNKKKGRTQLNLKFL